MNHDCRPNASSECDDTACVKVVFSQRDILTGEEICIGYYDWADLNSRRFTAGLDSKKELELFRSKLYSRFGITCPLYCFCKDSDTEKLVIEGRKLDEKMLVMHQNFRLDEALAAGEKLIKIDRQINTSWILRSHFYENLFEIAIGSKKTIPRARHYLQSCLEIRRIIFPFSKQCTLRLEELLKTPEKHKNYLNKDKIFGM